MTCPKKFMKRFIQPMLTTIETVLWVGYNPGASFINREFLKESNMPHRIEVSLKPSLPDPAGRRMSARIASDLGFIVQNLRVADEFIIDRDLNPGDLEVIVEEVFRDPVIQDATYRRAAENSV